MKKTNLLLLACIIIFASIITGYVLGQNHKHITAPASADKMVNPLKSNTEAGDAGKIIYLKMCKACHGDKGKGDGVAGISLNPRPADHTSAKIQALSDGALYWIITNGNAPMPTYKAILKDTERWQLVNYIRELGKGSKSKT